jgi:nucleoside-diphosphate-sugar epimerase
MPKGGGMNILVVGATGGSGRAAVKELLGQGHTLTAFVRQAALMSPAAGLRVFAGDVMRLEDVDRAVAGHDAVIVTLGIRENALLVRLRGSAGTPINVRSLGTANVIEAMRKHSISKLVVQSSFGVGETRHRLPLKWRLIFDLLCSNRRSQTPNGKNIWYARAVSLGYWRSPWHSPMTTTPGRPSRLPRATCARCRSPGGAWRRSWRLR